MEHQGMGFDKATFFLTHNQADSKRHHIVNVDMEA